ncbi:hypothetical protein HUU05_10105 [candidate division KSB1 bacterium]|nr:hypothetical protein [candidate division KSB1 bacterium]
MTTETISIPVDSEAARLYSSASTEDRKKLGLLLSLWLREYGSAKPLNRIMDEVSDKAQARGLTPELLESLLRHE